MKRKLRYEELPTLNSPRWLSLENLEGEEWRNIPLYDGYFVSNYGRVKSIDRIIHYVGKRCGDHIHYGKIIKGYINKKGYVAIGLRGLLKHECRRVHQLVMLAFCKKPSDCDQINHRDENKLNNCLYNLEYCNQSYNNNYGTRAERYSQVVLNDKRRSKRVAQYTLSGKLIAIFPSLHQIQRDLGFQHNHIQRNCNGKSHTSYGFKWEWV